MNRVSACNGAAVDGAKEYVLYWMTAYRRRHYNFALQRAAFWASELRKPLVVFEALACRYPWASARFHTFVIDGMIDNRIAFANSAAAYHAYVERKPGEGAGVFSALTDRACVVVTDDFPAFEIPRWTAAAAGRTPVLLEKVDSNGLLPMRDSSRVFLTASSYRRFREKQPEPVFPQRDPLAGLDLPRLAQPLRIPAELSLPAALNRSVAPAAFGDGGTAAGLERLQAFLTSESASSGLSPYFHFGHLSAHEVYLAVRRTRHPHKERFLDQLTTWRELGFNRCALDPDHDKYCSLPEWARNTLAKHARDARPVVYSAEQLENAATHDPLWNDAQRQLTREGGIPNRLRMLWGKKILEWSPSPEEALSRMIHLNNKYALDGRDPNSYNGIFWVLGRYDRPWGPERPIYGLIRYMSSENTAKKMRAKQ